MGSVPTTPDPNTPAKASRYKWEPNRELPISWQARGCKTQNTEETEIITANTFICVIETIKIAITVTAPKFFLSLRVTAVACQVFQDDQTLKL